MPKIPFRDRQEVQADVQRWTLDKRSVSEITSFLQDTYGKAYRKQNLLEDMRKFQQRELDLVKAARAVPKKYRKEPDKREHLLIYTVDKRGQPGRSDEEDSLDIRVRGNSKATVKQVLPIIRNMLQREQTSSQSKSFYFSVHMLVGQKEELEARLSMIREVENVVQWAMTPTENSAQVLSMITENFGDMQNTLPWIGELNTVALTSRVPSFQKLVKKVFE